MGDIVYGRHPVLAALRRGDSALEEVMVARGTRGGWLEEVRHLTRAAGVRFRVLERAALDRICGTAQHQGVAARRAAFAYGSAEDLERHLTAVPAPALLVAADGLTDPMNLGNLARSALAAGAHGLIIPKDRAAGVTPAVAKAAAGALEYLKVFRVTNLSRCLGHLRDMGLTVIGTAADAASSLYEADLTVPLVLVIGSEDKGLRPLVRRQCDLVLSIPLAAPEINSLNAAAAGAVALFEVRRQRMMNRGGGVG